MPLPEGGGKVPWPPTAAVPSLQLMRQWAAWWSGDPMNLIAVYGKTVGGQSPAPVSKNWFRLFWERIAGGGASGRPSERMRAYLHVPLASDMAATSAALLFSEPPTITIPDAHGENPRAEIVAASDELERIRIEGGFNARLIEGADFAAGLGGVYLKPTWDQDLVDYPLLEVVQPDQAWPEFRHGILVAVTLWREVERTDRDVVRHLERHELDEDGRPVVLHALYRGSNEYLGEPMSDDELKAKTALEPRVQLPFSGLGIHYVPNMRPNRRLRGSQLGQADYAGAEGLLDALDEAYASWMRDIRLGKARILVGRDMLDRSGNFDADNEVYSPLDIGNATAGTPLKDQLTAQQFEIRYEAHRDTTLTLIERIVSGPYSPQTFGLRIEGSAESGTALNIRERRTSLTQQRKGAWWASAIADCSEQMLGIAKEVFGKPVAVVRPSVEMSDSIAPAARELAETAEILNRAEAASRRTLVEMNHPDWTKEQVDAEVARILEERGLAVTPPEIPTA